MAEPFDPNAIDREFARQGRNPRSGETTRTAPEGVDVRRQREANRSMLADTAKAFGVSLLEGLTWQGGDRAVDRMTAPRGENLLHDAMRLHPALLPTLAALPGDEQGPVEQAVEDTQRGHPVASFLGEMAGGTVTGGLISKANQTALRFAGEHGSPWVRRQVQKWVNRPTGRIAGSTAEGTAEGAISAANEGESIAAGAGAGAVGGGGGQLALGEMLPGIVTHYDSSDAPQEAARYAINNARTDQGVGPHTGRDLDYDRIHGTLNELGSEASLMDANRGFTRVGEALVSTEPAEAQDILYRFGVEGERMGRLPEQFQGEVLAALPHVFRTSTQSGNVHNARGSGELSQVAKENRERLQPEWDRVLDNSPVTWNYDALWNDINGIVRFDQSTSGSRSAQKKIETTLAANATDRVVDADGTVVNPGYLTPRAVLTIRKELDALANRALKKGDRELASSLLNARKDMHDRLIDEVGEFATINAQYSNEFSYQRAYEAARKAVFSNTMDDYDLTLAQQHASPADLPGFLEGAAEAIVQRLETANDTTTAKNFLNNDRTQRKIKSLFGDDEGQLIIDAANRFVEFKRTGNKITGKSPTAPRAALRKELQDFVNRSILLAGMSRIATGRGTTYAPSAASTYSALGRDVGARAASAPEPVYPLLDQWLSAPGQAAHNNLDQMRRLYDEWYPSSSVLGRGMMPENGGALRQDIGNAPAQGLAVASAGGAERDERQRREADLISDYLQQLEAAGMAR